MTSLSEIARQAWLDCPLDGDHWEAAAQAVRKAVLEQADLQIAAASISGPVAMRVNQRDRIEVFKSMIRYIATDGKDDV